MRIIHTPSHGDGLALRRPPMSDRSKSAVYAELLGYVEQHGVSLAECGVGYLGLPETFARQFLSLLVQHNVQPIGMDVWRHTSRGFSNDALAGWGASSATLGTTHQDALDVLAAARLGPRDLVSFQF